MKLLFILLLGLGFSQNEVYQKAIDVSIENESIINLDYLFPDYDLDWALINIIGCNSSDQCIIGPETGEIKFIN